MDGAHAVPGSAGRELEQAVLEQAGRLLTQHVTRAVLAQADAGVFPGALWDALEEAGLPSATVPEAAGGSGLDARGGLLLVRATAFHAAPVPLAEAMLARGLWAEAGGQSLSGITTIAAATAHDTVRLQPDGAGWRLRGALHRVPWGRVANDVLLAVEAPDAKTRWVLAPAGSFAVEMRQNLANEPRDTLTFADVLLPAGSVREGRPGRSLLLAGALMRVQQMVGGMQRALESAVDYAMVRVQFGRAIAKHQAVQQMLAEAAGHLAAAVATADATLEADESALPLAIAVAKARVGEAAGKVAGFAHQVHAAMGFTQEHLLHHSTRRLWSWRDEFEAEPFWQRQVGRFVCQAGGEALWPLLADGRQATPFALSDRRRAE